VTPRRRAGGFRRGRGAASGLVGLRANQGSDPRAGRGGAQRVLSGVCDNGGSSGATTLEPVLTETGGCGRMQDDESAVSHTRLAYVPALDGVRAFAVVAVMMFHGGIPHMDGGFMGVDTFFVLSGFLITSLLIGEWRQTLTIKLGAFWVRRARRLLPALLMMLLFVAFFAAVIVPKGTYGALRLDALSTLLYVSNWHFILVNSNYFAENSATASPLLHTWSLAVEEQFYLIWPLVVLGVLHFTRNLKVLFGLCVAAAIGSTLWTYEVYGGGQNTNRAYRSACSSAARSQSGSCSWRSGATSRADLPGVGCGVPPAVPASRPVASSGSWARRVPCRSSCSRRRCRRSPTRAGSSSSASVSPPSSSPPSPSRAASCPVSWHGRRSATSAGSPTACTSGTGRSTSG